ncbi:excalibur calcium-binding domain-containing protein [Conchiformibius steedae DSM 2580]|uniref:Excalibur calcium-binding domain-containing protein n=1 Tax=Conchiformibius steedae DSM 2580 TaxID=1121352 RepID=A0AAE9L100_9NEIS|nr:excalibur calcium-binding domain-containing protein [Conchiformibius steedae]QMT33704.1 excalibur calcium-binding domain-containing protein [Conchiformibius steedae]URD68365.1 excalibur calcium-binding domain-containing protein [Conchiformibius steedae DSM 2580]
MNKWWLIMALAAGFLFWKQSHTRQTVSPAPTATHSKPLAAATPTHNRFRCDGRTHCSQMTSCEEATFFLRHCPNVKMDGNRDGIPCERQWCK